MGDGLLLEFASVVDAVACALAWGATAVGVASGQSSSRQLLDAGANLVFEDLSDTTAVMEVLGS